MSATHQDKMSETKDDPLPPAGQSSSEPDQPIEAKKTIWQKIRAVLQCIVGDARTMNMTIK